MVLSDYLKKTFADQKSRATQKGQALLEYILLLVIVVSIILGTLYQFNDAFKQYINTFFGDYVACLLETGELPQLGGDGLGSGECVVPTLSLNLSGPDGGGGGTPTSSGEGSSGGSSDSSAGDSGSSGNGSNRNASRSRPARFNSGGGTTNAEATGSSNAQGGRPGRIRMNSRIITNNSGNKDGFDGDSTSGLRGSRGRTIRNKSVINLGEEYLSDEAKKKKQNRVLAKAALKKDGGGGSSNLRKPNIPLNLPEARAKSVEIERASFSVGDIIKFLLIGGILIALFVFLGGQAMSIKKGWQKSE